MKYAKPNLVNWQQLLTFTRSQEEQQQHGHHELSIISHQNISTDCGVGIDPGIKFKTSVL